MQHVYFINRLVLSWTQIWSVCVCVSSSRHRVPATAAGDCDGQVPQRMSRGAQRRRGLSHRSGLVTQHVCLRHSEPVQWWQRWWWWWWWDCGGWQWQTGRPHLHWLNHSTHCVNIAGLGGGAVVLRGHSVECRPAVLQQFCHQGHCTLYVLHVSKQVFLIETRMKCTSVK